MENNLSNNLKLIEFSEAIINNDMESIKSIVDYLNTQSSDFFLEGFNLFDLINNKDNDAFKYTLDNLTTYPYMDQFKWSMKSIDLIDLCVKGNLPMSELSIFINSELELPVIDEYKYPQLIRMANIAHDYSSLLRIKQSLIQSIEVN